MSNIDKIRQEIERRKKICEGLFERESDTYYQGKAVAYGELLSFIGSLQQEQPGGNAKEKAISLQIQAYLNTASDELYAPGKPLYTEAHHKGIHECMLMWKKLHQYYFSTNQEQPEVDLEREVEKFCLEYDSRKEVWFDMTPRDNKILSTPTWSNFAANIARRFYDLGRNSRK